MEKLHLMREGKKILYNFFSNMKNFKIPESHLEQTLGHSLSSFPTLKALKYKTHPSISITKSFSPLFWNFYFSHVDKNAILQKITKLNLNKAAQDSDYFGKHMCHQLTKQCVCQNF